VAVWVVPTQEERRSARASWDGRERFGNLLDNGGASMMGSVMMAEQKSALADVVTIDKEVMHGTPCFAHTRVPVQTLIDYLETGETIDDFLAVYPAIPKQYVFSFIELSRDIAIDQLTCASL